MSEQENKNNSGFSDFENIIGDIFGENIFRDFFDKSRNEKSRDNVVMVRVDQDSIDKIDQLVEAEICKSRSESAAFLINVGIKACSELFDKISDKLRQIQQLKSDLKDIIGDELGPIQ